MVAELRQLAGSERPQHFEIPIVTLVLAVIAVLVPPAIANPAPIGSPGRTLVPFALKQLPGISIAEETLTIEDGKVDSIPSPVPGTGRMNVHCVRCRAQYRFANKTGKRTTVRVGFPVIAYSDVAGASYGGFVSLEARYGNTRLAMTESSRSKPMVFPRKDLAEVVGDLQSAGIADKVAESPDFVDLSRLGNNLETARAVLSKSSALAQKQKNRVLQLLSKLAFAGSDESLTGQTLIWYTFEMPVPAGLSEQLTVSYQSFVPFAADYSFSFILTTSRFWGHGIRRLKITIYPDTNFLKQGGKYDILPAHKFHTFGSPERYIYESEDKAPDFDVHVTRVPPPD